MFPLAHPNHYPFLLVYHCHPCTLTYLSFELFYLCPCPSFHCHPFPFQIHLSSHPSTPPMHLSIHFPLLCPAPLFPGLCLSLFPLSTPPHLTNPHHMSFIPSPLLFLAWTLFPQRFFCQPFCHLFQPSSLYISSFPVSIISAAFFDITLYLGLLQHPLFFNFT